jgi:hypothetical protein
MTYAINTLMNTIDRLLTQWDNSAQLAGFSNSSVISPTLVQNLHFVSRNEELQFEVKPQRSLFERFIRFIFGEREEDSFSAQVAKIKQIFSSIQNTLTEEEKARCTQLENRINALGRYVFAHRSEKTLFFCSAPTLSNYQIFTFSKTNQLIAPDVIKRSLYNPSSKLCWLNSSLKFLAASSIYDEMLTTSVEDIALEELRKALYRTVEALRKNWDQHLVNALQSELIQKLSTTAFRSFIYGQQDADEFIVHLTNHFPSPNREQIVFTKLYTSFSDAVWKPGTCHTIDKLQITPTSEESFDIEKAYTAETHLENVREYFVGEVPNASSDPLDFRGHDAVTAFPNRLEIMLKRSVGFDFLENNGQVSDAKIHLDEQGKITVLENEPVYRIIGNERFLVDVKPKNLCVFRAVAAIERSGGQSSNGHYIAHTRARDGTITTHNDSRITTNKTEAVWANAYYLMLELVDRMAIPDA